MLLAVSCNKTYIEQTKPGDVSSSNLNVIVTQLHLVGGHFRPVLNKFRVDRM